MTIGSHGPCEGVGQGAGACAGLHHHTARSGGGEVSRQGVCSLELQLEENHGDVCAVQDLCSMGQALGPELGGRLEKVGVRLIRFVIKTRGLVGAYEGPIGVVTLVRDVQKLM